MHNRILRAKVSLHNNIQQFITFPQENINILVIFPNFGLNWGYDVTKGRQVLEIWNFNLDNWILRGKSSLHENIQRFITFPQENINILLIFPNFGLNWGYDVTKGGQILEIWIFNLNNRILCAKIGLHDNIERFITFPQENINMLQIFPNFGLNWGYDVTKVGSNLEF